MMSNEFEKALDAFLEGADADEAHRALYDIIRAAFKRFAARNQFKELLLLRRIAARRAPSGKECGADDVIERLLRFVCLGSLQKSVQRLLQFVAHHALSPHRFSKMCIRDSSYSAQYPSGKCSHRCYHWKARRYLCLWRECCL